MPPKHSESDDDHQNTNIDQIPAISIQGDEAIDQALAKGEVLRKLLFETVVHGARLANDATTLSNEIEKIASISASSARTGISAMIGAKRAPSDELYRAIIECIDNSLSARGVPIADRDKWISTLDSAIIQLRKELLERDLANLGMKGPLARSSTSSSNRLLIPPGYLPINPDGKLDANLEPTRMRTTGLLLRNILGSDGTLNIHSKYVVGFADRVFAGRFWWTMFRLLLTKGSNITDDESRPVTADDALRVLRAIESAGLVKTYVLDKYFCLSPIMVYDPTPETETTAFHLYYQGDSVTSVQVPPPYVGVWKRFYKDMLEGNLGDRCKQFELNEHIDFLRQDYENQTASS